MNKYEALLKQDKKTFHAADLSLLWGIDNQDTLNMTLKRFVDRGILIRIHKGFYSTVPLSKLNPLDLGFAYLNTYSYVSLETILVREGLIFQDIKYITFVSTKSDTFELNNVKYKSRQLKDMFLNNTVGITKVNDHYEATVERAIADILYYNPKYYFDNSGAIDFDSVNKLQKKIGYVTS